MRRRPTHAVDELQVVLRALRAFRGGQEGSHLPGYAEQILFYLAAHSGGAAGLAELRRYFGLGTARASRLCAILRRAGLVALSRPLEDQRVVFVGLTAKGTRLIDRSMRP